MTLPIMIEGHEYDHFLTDDEFSSLTKDSRLIYMTDHFILACVPVKINKKHTEVTVLAVNPVKPKSEVMINKIKYGDYEGFVLLQD